MQLKAVGFKLSSMHDFLLATRIIRLNLHVLRDSGTHGFISSVYPEILTKIHGFVSYSQYISEFSLYAI